MYSSPTVKYGHVYIGRSSFVYCYDVTTGSIVWSHNLSSNTDCTPLVFGGRVYISAGSNLFCLDAYGAGGNTTRYWTVPISGTVDSSPTTDGIDDIFIASGNGYLKAIYTNGTVHWSSSINSGASSSPAYWNGRVYCGGGGWMGGDNGIYCFNAETGELIWDHRLDSPPCSSPAIAYGNVYIAGSGDILGTGEFGNIYCLDAMGSGGTTTEIWKYDIGGSYSSPAVGYGRVYIGSNTKNFYCLDAFGNGTGGTNLYWSKEFNDWSHCSPIITPKYVFTGAGDSRFYCLNRTDSSTVWLKRLGGDGLWGISSSPALAGNLILVTTESAGLYCVGAKADIEPPRILNNYPEANATEVNSGIEIRIRFNKPVDLSSISTNSIILKDSLAQVVSCSVRSNLVGDTAYLKPNNPLKKGEVFTVTVTTDIVDLIGFHLDGNNDGIDEGAGIDEYSFWFSTASQYPPSIGQIPTQRPTEDVLFVVDLSSYITDLDSPMKTLNIQANSSYITVKGLELHMLYPKGITKDIVNLSVTDGDFPNPTYRDFMVEIVTINEPPELKPIPTQILTEDILFELDISPYITDLDTPLSKITLTDNSSYTEINGLIISFKYPNGISYDQVNVSVNDSLNIKYLDIIVRISPVNDAPIIMEIPPVKMDKNVSLNLSLEDYISDIDNHHQDLVITVDSPYIKVYGHFLNITYPDGISEDIVNIKVSDGQLFDETTWIVKVNPVNDPPSNSKPDVKPEEVDSGTLGLVVGVLIIVVVIMLLVIVKKKKQLVDDGDIVDTDEPGSSRIQPKKGGKKKVRKLKVKELGKDNNIK
jgi:outer membrane protein assembly factor BamB